MIFHKNCRESILQQPCGCFAAFEIVRIQKKKLTCREVCLRQYNYRAAILFRMEVLRQSYETERFVSELWTVKRQLKSWCEKGLTFESSFAFYHYFRKTKIIRKQLYNATYNMEDLTAPCWILRSLYQNKKCHFLVRWRILVSILYFYLLYIFYVDVHAFLQNLTLFLFSKCSFLDLKMLL